MSAITQAWRRVGEVERLYRKLFERQAQKEATETALGAAGMAVYTARDKLAESRGTLFERDAGDRLEEAVASYNAVVRSRNDLQKEVTALEKQLTELHASIVLVLRRQKYLQALPCSERPSAWTHQELGLLLRKEISPSKEKEREERLMRVGLLNGNCVCGGECVRDVKPQAEREIHARRSKKRRALASGRGG